MVILRNLGHISFLLNQDYYPIRQCIVARAEFIERSLDFFSNVWARKSVAMEAETALH